MNISNVSMNKRIKIGYLDYSYIFSGAEVSLHSLIKNQDRERYESIIIFPYPQDYQNRYNDLGIEMIFLTDKPKWWMGTDYWQNPVRGSDFLKRFILAFLTMRVLRRNKIKLLHINLMRPGIFWWVWWPGVTGINVILHVRSDSWKWMPSTYIQKKCSAIICVSEYVKKMVSAKYRHPYLHAIFDPVDTSGYKPGISKAIAKKKLGLDPEKKLLSSVGLLSPHKGHDKAIESFRKLTEQFDDLILLIAGGGNKTELKRLRNLCNTKDLISKVFFTGDQIADIGVVYQASELVFSLTQGGEAFGRVPFEAAACGTPFIGPEGGAITEIIEDHKTGFLVNTKDIEAIVQTCRFILTNTDEVNIIKEEAFKTVSEKLNPQALTRRVCDIYDYLSGEKKK